MSAPDEVALAFLDNLYRDVDGGWLTLFSVERTGDSKGDTHVDWADLADSDGVDVFAATALDRADTCEVWFGVATRKTRLGRGQRGGVDDCATLPALFVDIDVAGPGHKVTDGLPENMAAAKALLALFPALPSCVVHTGGGLQAWWVLAAPQETADPALLLARWGVTWQTFTLNHGYRVDSVFNLDRVLRLPGTLNRKTDTARPVDIVEAHWERRYHESDFESFLLDLPVSESTERPIYEGDMRPGDEFNARHSVADVLTSLGFSFVKRDRGSGDEQWVGPWKDARDGTSATIFAADGKVVVWSDSATALWPKLVLRRPWDAFGLHTMTKYGGDFAQATRELRAEGMGAPQTAGSDLFSLVGTTLQAVMPSGTSTQPAPSANAPPEPDDERTEPLSLSSWLPVDLAVVLDDGYEPPVPTVLARTDGAHLFYAGRVNALNGESGSGKSWVEILAMREALLEQRHVLMIDFEDHAASVASRFTELGVPRDTLVEFFHYVRPDAAYTPEAAAIIEALIVEHDIVVVGIDSVGEAMGLQAMKQNDDDDVAKWFRLLPRALAALGCAVVIVDHVPKDKDAAKLYAIGSQRKRAAIDGVAYRVDEATPLGKGRKGSIAVVCAKDRNGHYTRNQAVATVYIDATGADGIEHEIAVPTSEDAGTAWRPTTLMEKMCVALATANGEGVEPSSNALLALVKGEAKACREALKLLVDEGYVATSPGPRKSLLHRLVRPYEPVESAGSGAYEVPLGASVMTETSF